MTEAVVFFSPAGSPSTLTYFARLTAAQAVEIVEELEAERAKDLAEGRTRPGEVAPPQLLIGNFAREAGWTIEM